MEHRIKNLVDKGFDARTAIPKAQAGLVTLLAVGLSVGVGFCGVAHALPDASAPEALKLAEDDPSTHTPVSTPAPAPDNGTSQFSHTESANATISNTNGEITITVNGQSRTFRLLDGKIPPAIQGWLDEHAVPVKVTNGRVRLDVAGFADFPDFPGPGSSAATGKRSEAAAGGVTTAGGRSSSELRSGGYRMSNRNGEISITITSTGQTRLFRLVDGKVPADIQRWLDENGIDVPVDRFEPFIEFE